MRTTSVSTLAGVAFLLSACGSSTDERTAASHALPFIADDYPTALAEARARKLPLFIESWAPW